MKVNTEGGGIWGYNVSLDFNMNLKYHNRPGLLSMQPIGETQTEWSLVNRLSTAVPIKEDPGKLPSMFINSGKVCAGRMSAWM